MSTRPNAAEPEPNRPQNDLYALAAQLGVDAALLDDFVSTHPRPTAAIVLGWANRHGDVEPDRHADDVEAWLARRIERRNNRKPIAPEELPTDGRLGPNSEGWG